MAIGWFDPGGHVDASIEAPLAAAQEFGKNDPAGILRSTIPPTI
jgi:hypothetical protein